MKILLVPALLLSSAAFAQNNPVVTVSVSEMQRLTKDAETICPKLVRVEPDNIPTVFDEAVKAYYYSDRDTYFMSVLCRVYVNGYIDAQRGK